MTLDLRQLRHLLAIVEHGTFGRAAAALNMTQPALSRSMKALEDQVGAALLVRSAAGATPTDEGRLLIQAARHLVLAADELYREVTRWRVPGSGHMVIGAGPFPAEMILPRALARVVAAHPLIKVRVLVRDWDELLRRLRAREVELFVAEISTLEGEHDLEVEALQRHTLFFVARRGHPLAGRGLTDLEDLHAFPMVGLSRFAPRGLKPILDARPHGAIREDRPFPQVELNHLAAVKRLIADSDAITALPLICVGDEVARGDLVILGTRPWAFLSYGIVRLKGQAPSAVRANIAHALREADAECSREEARLAMSPAGKEASVPGGGPEDRRRSPPRARPRRPARSGV